jgi:hypothetical protein
MRGPRWARYLGALLSVLACSVAMPGCRAREAVTVEVFRVEGVPLTVPKLADWMLDPTVVPQLGREGGLVMRLVQRSNVAGAPRIEVLQAPIPQPGAAAHLDEWLTQNLKDMGALETAGKIRILHVDQQRITVGHTPAYRVHHEFTAGTGNAQASLYQVSTFLVFEGRGLAISAAGRTELFHPQASAIARILDGVSLEAARAARKPHGGAAEIDLGTVGAAPR